MSILKNPTSILNKPIFDPHHLLWIHSLELFLAVAAIALSAPRLFMHDQPRTRATTVALGMGAKSILFILYQLSTSHLPALHKYYNLTTNLILNILEMPFWGAVIFLVMQAQLRQCVGAGCALGWSVVGVAVVMNQLAVYASVIAFREWYRARHPIPVCDGVGSEDVESVGLKVFASSGSHGETRRASSEVVRV